MKDITNVKSRRLKLGDTWNGWTVDGFLGEGSFGEVYRITRNEFGHTYESALKVIHVPQDASMVDSLKNTGMDDMSITAYFRGMVSDIVSELVLMSELKGNTNIVSYEDHSVVELTDSFGWDIYLRMEMLVPFWRHVKSGAFSGTDVIKMGIDMCRALELCRRNNIIHRDIKPENIFISKQGYYKLGDFGIARQMGKAYSELSKKGTYMYMAPEVYKGLNYNHTVDIYSLALVMYRLLNFNRLPFLPPYPQAIAYNDTQAALSRRFGGEPIAPPVNADSRLASIILKGCAYNPAARYQEPREMRRALEAYAAEIGLDVSERTKPTATAKVSAVPGPDSVVSASAKGNSSAASDHSLRFTQPGQPSQSQQQYSARPSQPQVPPQSSYRPQPQVPPQSSYRPQPQVPPQPSYTPQPSVNKYAQPGSTSSGMAASYAGASGQAGASKTKGSGKTGKIVGIVAAAALVIGIAVFALMPKIKWLYVEYNGDTAVGTVIDNSSDITVKAHYSNGKDKEVTGWTVDTVTLEPGRNDIDVKYKGSSGNDVVISPVYEGGHFIATAEQVRRVMSHHLIFDCDEAVHIEEPEGDTAKYSLSGLEDIKPEIIFYNSGEETLEESKKTDKPDVAAFYVTVSSDALKEKDKDVNQFAGACLRSVITDLDDTEAQNKVDQAKVNALSNALDADGSGKETVDIGDFRLIVYADIGKSGVDWSFYVF